MHPLIAKAKNSALTFPQVFTPGLAGAVIRYLTGGKDSAQSAAAHKNSVHRSPALKIGDPGERYTPELPNDGRTSGIKAAQRAAAQPVPATQLDRNVKELAS
ncbi:hypothetical protein [Corynebacterium macclintockiae]|uniref:hypothetical protein n=1 Tax=Corynebacterium macclintockiae TaxID=2913501 RepID=UPI003EBAB2B2